jgi:hypothetical protein
MYYTIPAFSPHSPSFEFDEAKSLANRVKHGIDFVEAQRLWRDDRLLEVDARSEGEPRHLVIGRIDGLHWSAIITHRGQLIRLISVRRSRSEEIARYEIGRT